MSTHDPRALLLDEYEVAERIHQSVSTVRRCRHATREAGAVRPMPGWRNHGSETKPRYLISEADLITWINQAPTI